MGELRNQMDIQGDARNLPGDVIADNSTEVTVKHVWDHRYHTPFQPATFLRVCTTCFAERVAEGLNSEFPGSVLFQNNIGDFLATFHR